ncbi:MAG: response regulator [Desulfovibrionaceae bacterium]
MQDILHKRNAELETSNVLLQVVNTVARTLLFSDEQSFNNAVNEVLRHLADSTRASRVYIWQNHTKADGRLYCDQVYEWSENSPPQQGNPYCVDISYDDVLPLWRDAFKRGAGINALVRQMSPTEQAQLGPQGIISILVRPISFNEEIWGFIGLDDCVGERTWSAAEESTLSACGILLAASIQKHRAAIDLRQAKDIAEAATSAKGEFLARMSHEIRTPMNAILGLLYLCLQTKISPVQRDYLHKIQQSANNLLVIINDILDFSKIEAQKLEIVQAPFVLADILNNVRAVVNVRAEEKNLPFTWQVAPDVPPVLRGDALRLYQVLVNLCGNAVKFTESGSVGIDVTRCRCKGKDRVRVAVRDTGLGLTKQEQGLLFQPFSQMDGSITRRYGGTGLGLAISKQLVELMGGDIGLKSKKDVGSVFYFTIPCVEASMLDADSIVESPSTFGVLTGYRVLLVEDNEINQMIAQEMLQQAGLDVTIAGDGEQACACVAQQDFDLIFMDVQMPVMDGLEATRRIRARPQNRVHPPIIAMTANAMNTDREISLAAGMNDHLTKPFDPETLIRIVRKWIKIS